MNATPLRSEPFRFDEQAAIHRLGAKPGKRLANRRATIRLCNSVRSTFEAAKVRVNPAAGFATELMFEALAASLGQVTVLKSEDTGHIYASDSELRAPDFRVVTTSGVQLLVEVKHCAQRKTADEFVMPGRELEALIRYAGVCTSELKIAVYWARLNLWTLVNPTSLRQVDSNRRLKLADALSANEMHLFGDALLATRFPLRLQILFAHASRTKSRVVERVELFSEDRRIEKEDERSIAVFLMLFGGWSLQRPVAGLHGDAGRSMIFEAAPSDEQRANPNQPFENIGFLSEIFSRYYRNVTRDRIVRQRRFAPVNLRHLIPDHYASEALPLWRFAVEPSETDAQQTTHTLDRIYAKESSSIDPILAAMQIASLPRDEW